MRFRQFFLLILLQIVIIPVATFAHPADDGEVVFSPKKFYASSCFDGALITTAFHVGAFPLNAGTPTTVGTARFTYFFNNGININYDFNSTIGIFTGLGIKNIGFIEKIKPIDSTIKRRVYSLGVPVGIKIGSLKKKTYAFLGGGVDIPVNYREKGFVNKGSKDKFNEWFSDRTPSYMAYGFAGISFKPGMYFKVQYYPGNFMNAGYTQNVTTNGVTVVTQPYARYDIELLMFSIGFDIRYSKKMKIKQNEPKETIM